MYSPLLHSKKFIKQSRWPNADSCFQLVFYMDYYCHSSPSSLSFSIPSPTLPSLAHFLLATPKVSMTFSTHVLGSVTYSRVFILGFTHGKEVFPDIILDPNPSALLTSPQFAPEKAWPLQILTWVICTSFLKVVFLEKKKKRLQEKIQEKISQIWN